MKALVTGAAGFIGSHLARALLDAAREVIGLDCFTDYYPRAVKEAKPGVTAGRGFSFVEAAHPAADLPSLLEGVTHVFHLAAQAGVRKSWGRDFQIYTATTSTRRSGCSRPASAAPRAARVCLEFVGLWRPRRRCRCAKTPYRSRSRRTE